MAHDRKLVLGGIALTMARNNRHEIGVMAEVRDELEQVMISTGYLDKAPFKWVALILRYGLKNDEEPSYQPINKRHGDLPVAIELDTHAVQDATRDRLKEIIRVTTLKVLIHVARKYGLPCERFVEMLREQQVT